MASNYIINNRTYSLNNSLNKELTFAKDNNYLFNLDYLGFLKITGDKARDFLQGQLSANLKDVTATYMQQGILANLKGRVICLLDIVEFNGLQLILPKDLIDIFITDLKRAALFSRVNFEISDSYKIFGLFIQNEENYIPFIKYDALPTTKYAATKINSGYCYNLGDNKYIFIIKTNADFNDTSIEIRGSLAWHYLQLQNKIIEIYPSTSGKFLPHRLNLHTTGYLNFDKGCYKGQEIIARTHFRAKLKHKLEVIKYTKNLKDSMEIEYNDETCELVDYSPTANDEFLAAIIKSIKTDA